MRTVTGPETTLLQGAHYGTHLRVKVEDADGTLQDISSRCVGGTIQQSVDQIVTTATLRFQMLDEGGQSLSPLDQTSTLNRDAGASYAALVDVGRNITVEVATAANNVARGSLASSDWQMLFDGTIDEWDLSGDGAEMSTQARDALGALIADRAVEREVELGSADGTAIQTVMQDILDEANTGITLYTPTSPGFLIKPYRQQKEPVLQALLALASLIGWVIEPRWDDSTGAFRLTFYEPDRTASSTAWTWAADRYYEVPRFALSRLDVRNALSVVYTDAATGLRSTLSETDATSIARFGRQWMEIEEGEDSPIDSESEAQTLLDAVLLDLKDPVAEGAKRTLCFWPVQLGDYYEFTGNDVHYSEDNDFGVTGFTHQWDRSGQVDTTLQIRGKPIGYTNPWLNRGGSDRNDEEKRAGLRLYSIKLLYDVPSDGKVRVTWARGSDVYEVAYYTQTLTQPITAEKNPWPADGASPTGVLAVGTDSLDLDVPASNQITFLMLEPRAEDANAGHPVKIEIDPKAISTGADLPANGDITYGALAKSAQKHGYTGAFTPDGTDAVDWASGTLTLTDGSSYSIGSGTATGLGAVTAPTYIYFDPTVSATTFQTTTDWSGDFGDSTLLIGVAWAGGVEANMVQSVGILGLDGNAIRPLSVTTGLIAANAITAGKISVATLSALSADLGTVTAGTVSTNVLIAADTFTASRATFTGELEVESNVIFSGGFAVQMEDGEILEFYSSTNDFAGDIRASGTTSPNLALGADRIELGTTSSDKIGFMGATPVSRPTVSGSRGGNAALADLLTELDTMGLITDSSS